MSGALTQKQESFVREYLTNGRDASAAYRVAYDCSNSSDKTVWEAASKLLRHSKVAPRISDVVAKAERRTEITVERVLAEYAKIGFADIRRAVKWANEIKLPDDDSEEQPMLESSVLLVPSDELDEEIAGAIAEVSHTAQGIKIKLHDKKGALDSIAKNLGMFVEKHQHEVSLTLEQLVLASMEKKDK